MAIYTQYGRYLKAKLFKEQLENHCATYMAFGIGNPFWDKTDGTEQAMPMASYNTTTLTIPPTPDDSTFNDTTIQQYYLNSSTVEQTLVNGVPTTNSTIESYKNLTPPFPCIWHKGTNPDANMVEFTKVEGGSYQITQSEYHKYYITESSGTYILHGVEVAGFTETSIIQPANSNSPEMSVFAELYLRGLSLAKQIKHPVGLLGMVKCDISFVIDLGPDDSNYTGDISQFWYGDRYWQIVEPLEQDIVLDTAGLSNNIYPHHLLITATVNPRQLNGNITIDKNLTPRQIAIFTKKFEESDERSDHFDKIDYKVGDYIFNFGQYTDAECLALSNDDKNKLLNFTLPCVIGSNTYGKQSGIVGSNRFEFLLHDYFHGTIKAPHQIDRFGYVVGF